MGYLQFPTVVCCIDCRHISSSYWVWEEFSYSGNSVTVCLKTQVVKALIILAFVQQGLLQKKHTMSTTKHYNQECETDNIQCYSPNRMKPIIQAVFSKACHWWTMSVILHHTDLCYFTTLIHVRFLIMQPQSICI